MEHLAEQLRDIRSRIADEIYSLPGGRTLLMCKELDRLRDLANLIETLEVIDNLGPDDPIPLKVAEERAVLWRNPTATFLAWICDDCRAGFSLEEVLTIGRLEEVACAACGEMTPGREAHAVRVVILQHSTPTPD